MLFLIAIASIYAATGTVNLAQLSVRLAQLQPDTQLVLQLLLLTVFSIKAAVFPLSAWLPDSYPTAPAPVTAVFAGLLTKVGVYAIIRTQTVLFPESPLSAPLMWAALLTMIIGILGAIAQAEIKRMLSFTLVSHIGYMIFGISLASTAGYAGAIFYTVHHITIQTTLFLVTGLIEIRGGSTSLNRLGGLAAALAGAGRAVLRAGDEPGRHPAVLGLHRQGRSAAGRRAVRHAAGVRPGRRRGADQPADPVRDGEGLEPGVLAGRSGAGRARAGRQGSRMPTGMVLTAGFIVALGIGLTVIAGPLYGYTQRAADGSAQRRGVRLRRSLTGGTPMTSGPARPARDGDERATDVRDAVEDDRHLDDRLGAAARQADDRHDRGRVLPGTARHARLPAATGGVPRPSPPARPAEAGVPAGLAISSGRASSVALLAFRRETPKSAMVRVDLRSDSDLYQTLTSELVSLVPGSIVVEARRSTRTLYLHVLDVEQLSDLEPARRSVLDAEARVIAAYGSAAEREAIREGQP